MGIAERFNTQRKRTLTVIFTEVLEGLHCERLGAVVYGDLICFVEVIEVPHLEKDDHGDDGCRCRSDFEILSAAVDLLPLDQAVVRTPQHGTEDSRQFQTACSGPIQSEVRTEGFAVYHFTGAVVGRYFCKRFGQNVGRFSLCKNTEDIFPVMGLEKFIDLMKTPGRNLVLRREDDDQKF